MTLTELWQKHGRDKYYTDKGDGHSYLPTYDKLFAPYQDKPVHLFEIGHSAGGALRLFDDYFTHPETRIIGIDQSDNDWLTMYGGKPYDTKRVQTYLQDVHRLDEEWFKDRDFKPDIIIEDSNHQLATQIWVVVMLMEYMNPGGLLVIEDVIWDEGRKLAFDGLNIPYELIDLNGIMYTKDNALLIFRT